MKKYLVHVFVLLILLLGAAAVWVVYDTLTADKTTGLPFEIPEGRYDCFMVLMHNVIVTSSGFPKPLDARGEFPLPPKPTYEETRRVLDFDFHVGLYHDDKTFARFAAQEAFRRIEEIASLVNLERPDSELSKINREAADHPVELSAELYFVLKRAREVSMYSAGAFDVTSSPLRWMWEHYAAQDEMPPAAKIREIQALVDWRGVKIDDKKRTITLAKKGMIVELHDIIRGFCMDQAVRELKRQGMHKGFVRTGDSRQLMDHPEGRTFIIGIPDGRAQLKYTFENDRPAVVTKGYYTGYKFIGNTIASGIVDPISGRCVGSVGSCTVVGPDAMTCDALATALCVMGGSKATRFIAHFNPREEQPE